MSAIVDFEYYATVYMGTEADEASFPALSARANDIVGAMTRWQITEDNIGTYPAMIQTLYRKAVCAQVDFFAVNGTETATGDSGGGWTVGKVSVSGAGSGGSGKTGAASMVCAAAVSALELTGLLNPQVPTLGEPYIMPWLFPWGVP